METAVSIQPAATRLTSATASAATCAAPGPAAGAAPRLAAVDWLRGLAVVLMIQTHLYDAWVNPQAKLSAAYHWTRFLGGIPSRLFLLLVGVSIALRFEAQIGKGVTSRRALVRPVQRRGLEILALAYLFRVQEYVLGHMRQSLVDLPRYGADMLRVDILNCIGASMLLVPVVTAPTGGRPAWARTLLATAVFVGLGPIIGPAVFPSFLPAWITSYLGGPRPMSWFGLFPWAAWPLAGVAVGHLWARSSSPRIKSDRAETGAAGTDARSSEALNARGIRASGDAADGPAPPVLGDGRLRPPSASHDHRAERRVFVASGILGLALIVLVDAVRAVNPHIIHYPSDLVQQMGAGSFFYRLGLNGVLACMAWLAVQVAGQRFSPMRQLGRTSLLVYWVHVELCYGLLAHRLGLYGRLDMARASVGLAVMVALMLGVSLTKTRWWDPWRRAVRQAR